MVRGLSFRTLDVGDDDQGGGEARAPATPGSALTGHAEKLLAQNKAELERIAKWDDQKDHIESINTVAAYCLIPTLKDSTTGGESTAKLSVTWKWVYMMIGIIFTFMQGFVVTSMINDGINVDDRHGAADTYLEIKFGIPSREINYCKETQDDWESKHVELAAINATDDPDDLHQMTNAFAGLYSNCIYGTENGNPMFWAEIITVILMLFFFVLETYAENSELFLQALLIHASPRLNADQDKDGNNVLGVFGDASRFETRSATFWIKSFLLDFFFGIRFYFVASIAVASGHLIVATPGIVESVLNGLALLFIVEFDEKTFALMVQNTHNVVLSGQIQRSRNIDIIFSEKARVTVVYSIVQILIAALVAFSKRLAPVGDVGSGWEEEFYAAVPGKITRAGFFIFLLAALGWFLHVVSVWRVLHRAYEQTDEEKSFHKGLAGKAAQPSAAENVARAPKSVIIALQLRSMVALVCFWFILTNLTALAANKYETAPGSDMFKDYSNERVNVILVALAVEVVMFFVLTFCGARCAPRVVQFNNEKDMKEIRRLIDSGEAEYGGHIVGGQVVERELPKDLGGVSPASSLRPLEMPRANMSPEEQLASLKQMRAEMAAPLPGALPDEPEPELAPAPSPRHDMSALESNSHLVAQQTMEEKMAELKRLKGSA